MVWSGAVSGEKARQGSGAWVWAGSATDRPRRDRAAPETAEAAAEERRLEELRRRDLEALLRGQALHPYPDLLKQPS